MYFYLLHQQILNSTGMVSGNKEDTTNMTAFIERTGLTFTAQNNPDQSTVKRIKAIWPKMTITNSDTVDFYVGTQMSTEEGVSWKGPFAFNPDTQSKVSCRASGKLLWRQDRN